MLSVVRSNRDQLAEAPRNYADIADRALAMLDIDEHGLDEMDKRILETLVHKFAGKPVGVGSLAVAVIKSTTVVVERSTRAVGSRGRTGS